MGRTLTSLEAAQVLGVKLETLYAYVSRGMLTSHRPPSGRSSRFDAAEVRDLARRKGAKGRADELNLGIRSQLTLIDGGQLFYRGVDCAELAERITFESAATWLWTTEWDAQPPWLSHPDATALGRAVSGLLPAGSHLADRIRVIVAAVATTDPLRFDLRAPAVVGSARSLLASMVDSLPTRRGATNIRLELGSGGSVPNALAARLWPRLSRLAPTAESLRTLNAAMVLLADHELAASTLAARVAASTRADPFAVVMAGLGPLAGPLHGSASAGVFALLEEAASDQADRAVGRAIREQGRLQGFGHPLYPQQDPRAERIMDLLRASRPDSRRMAVVDAVLDAFGQRAPVAANVDFALAALAFTSGMSADTGEAIFAISRSAGWIAHALEEYDETPLRFRPRAIYGGPMPPG